MGLGSNVYLYLNTYSPVMFLYFNYKSQKCIYLIYDLYLKVFANITKYTYVCFTKKSKALPQIV